MCANPEEKNSGTNLQLIISAKKMSQLCNLKGCITWGGVLLRGVRREESETFTYADLCIY